MESVTLRPGYAISRVIRGNWQLAGGHGTVEHAAALDAMAAAFAAGLTTFDCADIYTGVEALIGAFRRRLGAAQAAALTVHTKLVPDLESLPGLRKADIAAIVDRSLQRLGVERLDLVQFHWWDYAVPGAAQAMLWLDEIRRAGKIAFVGATNFDATHIEAFLKAGVPLLALQTQYSLLDARPANGLAALCQDHAVALLCYGTVAGGFLSDAWLGQPDPAQPLANRSLVKYRLIIEDFGGWALFQDLLRACRAVADRHDTDIATVASRWALDQPGVAAVIVGARDAAHAPANARIGTLALSPEDHAALASVLAHRRGPSGDAYTLERDRHGPHGAIMKYNLNAIPDRGSS